MNDIAHKIKEETEWVGGGVAVFQSTKNKSADKLRQVLDRVLCVLYNYIQNNPILHCFSENSCLSKYY